MLTSIVPKLPMRKKDRTLQYYVDRLQFNLRRDYGDYLILEKDEIEIHFFLFENLNPNKNYGQIYVRTNDIEQLYRNLLERNVEIHPNAPLETKPWGQKEFALLDPDHNLITFGQAF
ncbi:VOC family protein [Kaistella sp. 97-N-M2]|uniref:bleomycin resistance protein n=1 Tax=Kaistella sp. 97-N-M2 TaxID=2908645 RepID=UPI001F1C8A31|nr:VOC family protein [Kaistella sp. 97-N-M2]UJF30141.1 VOC family protein [Kaistella sp. 97-N-M2]